MNKNILVKGILVVLFTLIIAPKAVSQNSGLINYKQYGLSFKIPSGWIGQESDGLYIMTHTSIPGMIFIIPHSYSMTTNEMMSESTGGLIFDDGTKFMPNNLSQINKNAIGGEFEGIYDYTPAKAFLIGMANPKGNGITILSITSSEVYSSQIYKGLALDVQSSVVFTEVQSSKVSTNSGNSKALNDWNYQLGNTKLTYTQSYYSGGENGGGYNMREEIHLCKAGYFLFFDQSMVAVGGSGSSGYSGGNSQGHGTWKIFERAGTFVLALSFTEGKVNEYNLAWGEDYNLFLNGYRYYRTWEGDYAPDCFR